MPSRRGFLRGFAALLGYAALPVPAFFLGDSAPESTPPPTAPPELTVTFYRAQVKGYSPDPKGDLISRLSEAIARDIDRDILRLLEEAAA